MTVEEFRSWPKVDLHRHLEGSFRPETFFDIATSRKIEIPARDISELRPLVQVTDDKPDFLNFLSKFRLFSCFWPDQESIERVAYEAVEDAAKDNVIYLELRYAPMHFARGRGFDPGEVIRWVNGAARKAAADYDIRVEFIACAGRHFAMDINQPGIEAVLENSGEFVGFDIAGDEINYPLDSFADYIEQIKGAGLGLTLHAGEAGPASNIREAITRFGADRIGHGVRVIDDELLLDLAIERQVAFEMCLTSNLQTATVPDLSVHPALKLLSQGLTVTLNTDDPEISNITLSGEFGVAVSECGFSLADLRQVTENAVRSAFLSSAGRDEVTDMLRKRLPVTEISHRT